jgi:hypothetical protein
MTFTIRRPTPSDWEAYRAIRLRSLLEEPQAYESQGTSVVAEKGVIGLVKKTKPAVCALRSPTWPPG